jgi:hypothetical protein
MNVYITIDVHKYNGLRPELYFNFLSKELLAKNTTLVQYCNKITHEGAKMQVNSMQDYLKAGFLSEAGDTTKPGDSEAHLNGLSFDKRR